MRHCCVFRILSFGSRQRGEHQRALSVDHSPGEDNCLGLCCACKE
jgi:hypothetical protein